MGVTGNDTYSYEAKNHALWYNWLYVKSMG